MKTTIRMKHPLRSTGTHQAARLLRAIAPGHFRLDERSMQDLITAAHSYARMLTYVDPGGQTDGDWTIFWEVENLTYMAVLAATDTDQLRKGYEDIDLAFGQTLLEEAEKPKKGKKAAKDSSVSADFNRQLLRYLRDMAAALEKHYTTLRPEIPLKDVLLKLIVRDNKFPYDPTNVDGLMQQLVAYHKAADDHLDPEPYKIFFQADSRWGIRNRDEYDCILPDETYDRQKLRGLFVQLFNISLTLKARAQQMFDAEVALLELPEEMLERRLEPHIALFITFLQLFRHAQEGMNDIPRRHLDFYYHSVLGLERRPADPDHAYLIFTLAKEFSEELVEKGTLVAAGKDKKGRPIQFETLERWKVTKASIEEIRNTAITPDYINASTISEKGIPPEKAFRLFGDDGSAPAGELGFAIASPQLLLLEGRREVEVTLDLQGPIEYANEYPEFVAVKYSTGEGFQYLEKLAAGKSGFALTPVITPFAAMQSVEPARRLVNELSSDMCEALVPVGITDPLTLQVKQIYDRAVSLPADHFVYTKIFYPALSAVLGIRQLLERDRIETDPKNKLSAQFKAELYFYRAYYLYSLASVFASPYNSTTSAATITQIPDLRNHDLPQNTAAFVFYTLENLYQDVLSDLTLVTGQWAAGEGTNTSSKTSINRYTVEAFRARIYLQMGNWDECIDACDMVISNSEFKLDKRGTTATEHLNRLFDDIENSPEVIWALETTRGDDNASLFDFLSFYSAQGGESTRRFFKESDLLDTLYRGNQRYEEREPHTLPSPDGGSNGGSGGGTSGTVWQGHPAAAHYDYRDSAYYQEVEPLVDGAESTFHSSKYFRENQTLVCMIRLSEIYLNKAQAAFKSSNVANRSNVRRALNEIRRRAGALPFLTETGLSDDPAIGYLVTSIEQYHIEEERARELAFEGDRREFVRAIGTGFCERALTGEPEDLAKGVKVLTDPPRSLPWQNIPYYTATTNTDQILQIQQTSSLVLKLTLKEDAPPVLQQKDGAGADLIPYPMVMVTFGGKTADSSRFYNFLKKQTLTKATIKVTVTGIQKNLVLQNDFGVFDGTQRFYPFGPVPENSARFFLGCQEAFTKKLESVAVAFDWVEEEDIVKGVKGYNKVYENYKIGSGSTQVNLHPTPKVVIDLLKEAEFTEPLFPPPVSGQSQTDRDKAASAFVIWSDTVETPAPLSTDLTVKNLMRRRYPIEVKGALDRFISSEQVTKYSATQKRGFLRFKLEGDFGRNTFNNLTIRAASKEAGVNFPHEPYTPATNSVSLNYVSTQVMEDAIDQFFHVLPFQGGLHQADFSQSTSLVYGYPSPTDEPQTGGFYPANLFLGMKNLVPGDNLSLLFQTLEGSELLADDRPPRVYWMYLASNNQWTEIPVQKVLRDTTRGLTRSGMIQIAIPNDLSSWGNTMLNPALLWLRASVVQTDEAPEKVGAFSSLLDIRAQAIEARFRPAEGNDLERLDSPLLAQSVSGLAESSAAVKKVEQPYATFGGRKPESEGSPEYHRRISERLRHKDRAVTAWDYERLLLEQYPLAAIAKCIPHTRYEDTEGYNGATELAPGFVTIAVVPDLVRRPNMVRTEPRFSRGDLEEMRDFLLPKTNAFVHTVENKATGKRTDYLQVVNPKYEAVSVAVKVWLVRGADQNLAVYELDQALRHFFSPWLKDSERLPQFSRVVRRSHLIQMIEQLDFVDAIEELTIKDFEDNVVSGTLISPGTARSILTTGEHLVEIADGVGGKGGAAPRAALAPPPPPGPDAGAERDAAPPIRAVEKAPAAPPISPEPATPKTATRTPKSAKRK